MFIFLLGNDINFGYQEAVNLLSSIKYTEKQIVSGQDCVYVCVCVSERERPVECVYVCERERESPVFVCVRERTMCVSVCLCVREEECV